MLRLWSHITIPSEKKPDMGQGIREMYLGYFMMFESKGAIKDYWSHVKRTQTSIRPGQR